MLFFSLCAASKHYQGQLHFNFMEAARGYITIESFCEKGIVTNHVARRPAWAQCADFHCNVTVQVKTTMRKWTLAHGGEIGAKDMSTLWWQKTEYLNWGPDGTCTPWAGGSLHSWNQPIPWKEAERPSLFDGRCSSHMIGILREVWELTVMTGLFLTGPDFNLELYPKTFLFFLPLSFFISLNSIFQIFLDSTFVFTARAWPLFSY